MDLGYSSLGRQNACFLHMKPWVQSSLFKASLVMHECNASTQDVKAERSEIQKILHITFEVSQKYRRPYFK